MPDLDREYESRRPLDLEAEAVGVGRGCIAMWDGVLAKCRGCGGRRLISHDEVHDWSPPYRCIDQSIVRTRLRYDQRLVLDRRSHVHQPMRSELGQLSKYFVPIATECVV